MTETISRRSRHVVNDGISLSAVEQRVFTVEQSVQTIGAQFETRMNAMTESVNRRIDRLSEALEKKSTPQYQTMFAGMGVLLTVLGMIGTIVYVLIQSQINYTTQQTALVSTNVATVAELIRSDYVPRVELQGWRDDARERMKTKADTDNDRLGRISDAITDLRKNSITLSDHQAVIDRVARLEQVFGSTYSVGDVLKDIQNRLSSLERPMRATSTLDGAR